MTQIQWKRVAALLGLLVSTAVFGQRGAVDLSRRWEPEVERRYVLNEKMVQEVSGEHGTALRWSRRVGFTERVESREGGVATVERRYDSMRVDVEGDAIDGAVWDSDDPTTDGARSNPLIAPFAGMVGQVVRFRIGEDGTVLEASGGRSLWSGMLGGFSGSALSGATSGAAPSNEALRKQIEDSMRSIPEKAVRPRSSWAVEADHATPIGVVRSEIAYTLDRVTRTRGKKLAEIGVEGALSLADASRGGLASLMGGLGLVDSSVEGAIEFDVERGVVVRSELRVRSSWGVEIGDEFRDLLGDESHQTITQHAVMELIDE